MSRHLAMLVSLGLTLGGAAAAGPAIDAVEPERGTRERDTTAVVLGSGFEPGSRVSLLGGGPLQLGNVQMPGGGNGVFCVGDHVYTSFYDGGTKLGGFTVVDAGDPTRLREIGRFELGDTSASILVAGEIALVPFLNPYTFIGGMHLVDVSDPQRPVRVESYFTLSNPQGLDEHAGTVYVADVTTVQIIDVRDPRQPTKSGELPSAGSAWDVATDGALALVADGAAGLQVFDVRDPSVPVRLGGLAQPGGFALGVALDGTTAFVADFRLGLQIVDVADPAAPKLLASIPTADSAADVAIREGRAFVADGVGGLQVFDVTSPSAPRWVGAYTPRGASTFFFELDVVGDRVYVADLVNGLRAIDVSVAESPASPPGTLTDGDALALARYGEWLAVAEGTAGVGLYEIEAGGIVRARSRIPVDGAATDVALRDSIVYVAAERNGLQLFSVADPDLPASLGVYDSPGTARGLALDGELLYLADDRSGLQVVDVGDPAAPTRVGGYNTRGVARGVHVAGGIAYVADDTRGVQIIDVTDPAAPALLGTADTPGRAEQVVVRDGVAWVADANRGIQVIDVSDPAAPTLAFGRTTDGRANDLLLRGDLLLVADGLHGLIAFDVTDRSRLIPVAHHDTPGSGLGLAADDTTVWIADGRHGIRPLMLNPAIEQPLGGTSDRIPFVVPAGFAAGPYDVRVTLPGGEAAERANAFSICAERALQAELSAVESLAFTLSPDALWWRLEATGDPAFFGDPPGHTAALTLPALSGPPEIRFRSSERDLQVIELHLGLDVGPVVRLIGHDEAALRTLWASIVDAGGIDLQLEDSSRYVPLALTVRPRQGAGSGRIEPLIFEANGLALRVHAPRVYRYVLEGASLFAARAWGDGTDLSFVLRASDGGCDYGATAGWLEAAAALCRDVAPDRAVCAGGPATVNPGRGAMIGARRQ